MKHKKQISRSKFGRVVEEEYNRKELVYKNEFYSQWQMCGIFLDENFKQSSKWRDLYQIARIGDIK